MSITPVLHFFHYSTKRRILHPFRFIRIQRKDLLLTGKRPQQPDASARQRFIRIADPIGPAPVSYTHLVIAASDVVILAVKPYQLEDVLAPIREQLKEKLILSVAAGMPFASLESMLAPVCAHLSMIPNTPISTGNGVIVCEQTHSLSEEQLQLINDLFSPCAQLVFVHTDQLSVAGTLSGCGPAFVFLMIEALADAGVKYGLERAKAYAPVSYTHLDVYKRQTHRWRHWRLLLALHWHYHIRKRTSPYLPQPANKPQKPLVKKTVKNQEKAGKAKAAAPALLYPQSHEMCIRDREKERLRQRCMLSVRMYEKRYPRRIMQEIYTRMDAQVYGS